MKNFIIGLLFLCGFYACSSGKENISEVDCAQYVNPFIGNADMKMTRYSELRRII